MYIGIFDFYYVFVGKVFRKFFYYYYSVVVKYFGEYELMGLIDGRV